MANDNLWYLVGVALRKLLGLDKAGGSGGSNRRAPERTTAQPQTGETPRLKPKPASPDGHGTAADPAPERDYGESPGQFGPGATRDASAGELADARLEYAPSMDGDPDPGEIVWTWVPYVENDGRGKDRPVLILGRIDASTVFGCYVSSKVHRDFISIGRGSWDSQGRESFVSPERILRVTHSGMRREGAVIPRDRFDAAVAGVLAYHRVG